jgi:hypothetical protein
MLTRRSNLHARERRAALLAMLAVLLLAVSGCGGDDEARSQERPPAPINISVLIAQDKVIASPDEFGAGPVTLLIANQSGAAQTLTVDGPRLTRTAGPIPPGDTATVKVTLGTGEFTVSPEESASLEPATLTVGPPRDSAQNDLLLP